MVLKRLSARMIRPYRCFLRTYLLSLDMASHTAEMDHVCALQDGHVWPTATGGQARLELVRSTGVAQQLMLERRNDESKL